jgi:hypothetical protein
LCFPHFYRCPSTCEPGDPKTAFFRGLSGPVPFVGWLYVNSQQPLPRGVRNILSSGISTFQSISCVASFWKFNLPISTKSYFALQNVCLRFSQSPRAWSGPCLGPGDRLVQAVCDRHRMRLRLPHDCRGKRLQFSRHTPRGKCPGLSEPAT